MSQPFSAMMDINTLDQTSATSAIVHAEQTAVANAVMRSKSDQSILSPPMVDKNDFAPMPTASPSKSRIDPDGDLFDLEEDSEGELISRISKASAEADNPAEAVPKTRRADPAQYRHKPRAAVR